MSKLAVRAQTVDIANLPLRQDLLAKNVLMTAQRNFCLGNGPLIIDDEGPVPQMLKHLGEMRGWACMLAARVNPSRHSNSGSRGYREEQPPPNRKDIVGPGRYVP